MTIALLRKCNVLAHRGLWIERPHAKNSLAAIEEAVIEGFGIETDIRDHDGELVIEHDLPLAQKKQLSVRTVLNLLKIYTQSTAAFNVKSDGLQQLFCSELERFAPGYDAFFLFDWSLPDGVQWKKMDVSMFSRLSEFEPEPQLLSACKGVWIDAFLEDFNDFPRLTDSGFTNKKLCFVSPELHSRDHLCFWYKLKKWIETNHCRKDEIYLCTDFPEHAYDFFND